jgi:hypothetical protein
MSFRGSKDKIRRWFLAIFISLGVLGWSLMTWQSIAAKTSAEESVKDAMGDPEHPPYVAVISLPHLTRFVVTNASNHPAYGIRIRLVDDTSPTSPGILVHDFVYSELAAHTALMEGFPWTPPNAAECQHFTALIATRNGVVMEEMILMHDGNDQWAHAIRVMQGSKELERDVDSNWPREANHDIRWGR